MSLRRGVDIKLGGVYANEDRTTFFYAEAEQDTTIAGGTKYRFSGSAMDVTWDGGVAVKVGVAEDEYMDDGRYYSWHNHDSPLDMVEDITGTELAVKVLALISLQRS